MREILFLTVFIIGSLFTGKCLLMNQDQARAESIQLSKNAPDFTFRDIKGMPFRLSDLKGKVVLLDFWATWCPFCRESIPVLKSLYDEHKDKGLEVVGIALEYDGGKALKRFAKEKKINYTILIGSEELAKEYSAYGVPTRFIINREGKIVEKFIGFQDKDTFESLIQKLL